MARIWGTTGPRRQASVGPRSACCELLFEKVTEPALHVRLSTLQKEKEHHPNQVRLARLMASTCSCITKRKGQNKST
jgi:hypothetical protein